MSQTATAADLRASGRPLPHEAVLMLIPAALLVAGLLLRYAAYAGVIPDASPERFVDALCRWDCEWYVRIAEGGYDPFPTPRMIAGGNWAFFPLYPVTVGGVRFLTGLPTMQIATGLSLLLSFLTARLAWPLFEGNLRAYTLFAAYMLAGPFSMYFTTYFTEAPFILLTVCVMLALRRSNYLLAGGFAALLSGTRIVGVMMVFGIVVQAFVDHLKRGGSLLGFVPAALRDPRLVLAVFVAPVGLFVYMAFLHASIGDALAFQHVQRAWARTYGSPIDFLWRGFSAMPEQGVWPTAPQQLAAASVIGLLLSLVLAWRRQYAMAVFCLICLSLPLFAGIASMVRFVAALAPLAILCCTALGRWRWLAALSLAGCLYASYAVTSAWLTGFLSLV